MDLPRQDQHDGRGSDWDFPKNEWVMNTCKAFTVSLPWRDRHQSPGRAYSNSIGERAVDWEGSGEWRSTAVGNREKAVWGNAGFNVEGEDPRRAQIREDCDERPGNG